MEVHGRRQRPPPHLLPRESAEPDSGKGEVTVPEKQGWGGEGGVRSQQCQGQEFTGDVEVGAPRGQWILRVRDLGMAGITEPRRILIPGFGVFRLVVASLKSLHL